MSVFFPHGPFQELINGAKMALNYLVTYSNYGYMWGYRVLSPYIGAPGGERHLHVLCAAVLSSGSNPQPSDPKEWVPPIIVAGTTWSPAYFMCCPNFGRMLGHSPAVLAILRPAMLT